MPKIRDRTIIHWLDNNEPYDEEFIFYGSEEEEEEEEQEQKTQEPDFEVADDDTQTLAGAKDLQLQMIILLISECVEKFAIMKCIAQKNYTPVPFKFPEYKTLEERYGDKIDYGKEFFSEGLKRFHDLCTIYSVLFKTLEDLVKNGTFTPLTEGTNILKRLREEEIELLFNETNSIIRENEMKQKLVTEAKLMEEKYAAKLEELRQLEVGYENAIGYGRLEEKYVDRWEASRRHQGLFTLEKAENYYTDIITSCEVKSELENKIHDQIVKYFEESMEDMNNQIEYWMEEYDSEIERRDAELLKLKIDRDAQTEKYEHMKEEYEKHEEFIKYWSEVKAERKRREERLLLEWTSSIVIQSWWRMVMVKRQLGKFKRKKRKPQDKNKKKR